MALKLEDKKTLVKEVNVVAGESLSAIAAEYRGLSVTEMTELRREAREAGVYLRVVKNTLVPSKGPNLSACRKHSRGRFCSRSQRKIQEPLPG